MTWPNDIQIGNDSAIIWLWSIGLIVASIIMAGVILRLRKKRFATADRLDDVFVSGSGDRWRTIAHTGILIFAVVLLTIGLMDWRWGKIQREVPQEGIEVMFLLDVSRSMLAQDATPNRLERAKQMIRDMIAAMAGDRIGLVAFAGESRRITPLTSHYEDFIHSLADVGPEDVRRGGSKLGNAIGVAADGFLSKTNAQRVIVVLTDGEDQESAPEKVAKQLYDDEGIRIFTIGLGDMQSGARIPDPQSQRYVRYQGEPVVTKLNGKILEAVAQASDGAYVPAGTKQVDMKAIYDRYIAGIEKSQFDTAKIDAYDARFQWFAVPALVLLLIEAWLNRTGRRIHPRKASTSALRWTLIIASSWMIPASAHAQSPSMNSAASDRETYNRGVQAYRDADLTAAIEAFELTSRSDDPDVAAMARYNLGTSLVARIIKQSEVDANDTAANTPVTPDTVDSSAAQPTNQEQLQSAIDSFQSAIHLRPRWNDARANLEKAIHLLDELNKKSDQPKNESSKDEQSEQEDQESSDQSNNESSQQKDGQEPDKKQGERSEKSDGGPPEQSENEQSEKNQPEQESDGKSDEPDDEESEKASEEKSGNDSSGQLQSDNSPASDESQAPTTSPTEITETTDSMTEEEAQKMLQAVRDRDLIRRFRQQVVEQSRQIPVDKDW